MMICQVDLVTPMCSQLTYEGVIDEVPHLSFLSIFHSVTYYQSVSYVLFMIFELQFCFIYL
jgi:hypothetical protein